MIDGELVINVLSLLFCEQFVALCEIATQSLRSHPL